MARIDSIFSPLVVAARTDAELRASVSEVDRRFVVEAEATFRRLLGLPADRDVRAPTRLLLAVFDGLAMNHVLGADAALGPEVVAQFAQLIRPWAKGALAEGALAEGALAEGALEEKR